MDWSWKKILKVESWTFRECCFHILYMLGEAPVSETAVKFTVAETCKSAQNVCCRVSHSNAVEIAWVCISHR